MLKDKCNKNCVFHKNDACAIAHFLEVYINEYARYSEGVPLPEELEPWEYNWGGVE
jgi:hypothetical protein